MLLTAAFVAWEGPLQRSVWIGAGVALVTGAILLLPLQWDFYQAHFIEGVTWNPPTSDQIAAGGVDPRSLLAPHHLPSRFEPVLDAVLGDTMEFIRGSHLLGLCRRPKPAFPGTALGYSLLMLVFLAAVIGRGRRRWGWLVLGTGALVLSFGPYLRLGRDLYTAVPLPYALLRYLPAFSMAKTHDRFVVVGVLGLSIFAAFGVAVLFSGRVGEGPVRRRMRHATAGLVALAVLAEYSTAAPPVEEIGSAAFALELAKDERDVAVVHYPPARSILEVEQEMWQQVTHGKRLLRGFLARLPIIPALQGDPAYTLTRLRLDRLKPAARVAMLQRLFDAARFGVEYLVVEEQRFTNAEDVPVFIAEAKRRHLLVYEPAPDSPDRRWLFYVGGSAPAGRGAVDPG